jgi:hypothetical protein
MDPLTTSTTQHGLTPWTALPTVVSRARPGQHQTSNMPLLTSGAAAASMTRSNRMAQADHVHTSSRHALECPQHMLQANCGTVPACCPAGKCFELQCVNKDFHDGYGQPVRRSGACYDESKKVVVKIIDRQAHQPGGQPWAHVIPGTLSATPCLLLLSPLLLLLSHTVAPVCMKTSTQTSGGAVETCSTSTSARRCSRW